MVAKLIFVYNADAGKLNALLDAGHKIVSPSTYACNLCDLTYGVFREKEEWVRFRESVNIPLEFLHKDEFQKAYRSKWLPKYDFPVVLAETGRGLEIVISTQQTQELKSLEELIATISSLLSQNKE